MRRSTQRLRRSRPTATSLVRVLLGGTLVIAGIASVLLGALVPASGVASADGPAPCTVGGPPFPFAGFCATYSDANTWYGSYGPGFPTDEGWAFCADPPASGGDYPAPDYDYVPSGPPSGADTQSAAALGFAFSQTEAMGWWGGLTGQFTTDQAAVAGKLLYDAVVWGSPVPSMDPGVLAAFNAINGWYLQASGASGAPQLSTGLVGGGTSFETAGSVQVTLRFPGSQNGLEGVGLSLTIANGTFDSPTGPTSIGISTDDSGNATAPIFNNGGGPVSVTASTSTDVGQAGLDFYAPTARELTAQQLAAFSAPVALDQTLQLTAGTPTGTISIDKSGDDTSYYGLSGAVFDVMNSAGESVATLTTDTAGLSPPSGALVPGAYTVHEVTPPFGYLVAANQTATVTAGQDTVVSYAGASEEHIVPASLGIDKTDVDTGVDLAGAVFDVAFDPTDGGVFSDDLGTCTTDGSGGCAPPGNDGTGLLPGNYRITEVTAPPGYYLDPSQSTQDVALSPGEQGSVRFADLHLGSVEVDKTGDDTAYAALAGATFSLTGPAPAAASVGTLTVGANGQSNVIADLVPGTYTLTETVAPAGYQASGPISVAVAGGLTPTVIDVLDHVQPATLGLRKVDSETNAPLSGAVLDVRYDSGNSGTYDVDLGSCTTDAQGACAPAGNDGAGEFLPGSYQVTEVQAPPGYAVDQDDATQDVSLSPGGSRVVTFDDPKLVAASFVKDASGNVDPATVSTAGAVFAIAPATGSGPPVATCTTDASGSCTTTATLDAGDQYCWSEPTAPPGLAAAAGGCFTATDDQASTPIDVTDRGTFVAIAVDKVDAENPSTPLSGVAFDLYRMDNGDGPDQPSPPDNAPSETAETWTARATTGPDGIADFPLQFPGYAYCVLEVEPPPNYVADAHQHCTSVLVGSTTVPSAVTSLVVGNTEATVTVTIHKFDVLQPGTGIPGATYDLYVEGPVPPSGVRSAAPSDAISEPDDTWYARGTTGDDGVLDFTVPAGHAWCVREVTAPADYLLDPALHCTAVLTTESPSAATTVALPETRATVHISAYKFDVLQPNTTIPNATYELLAQDADPPGGPAAVPADTPVPEGDAFWGEATTNADGVLTFAVPAGYSWCLHEIQAPADYRSDPAFHCTAVLTADSPVAASTLAVPEVPAGSQLAFTGGPTIWLVISGALLVCAGVGAILLGRGPRDPRGQRRTLRGAHRSTARARRSRRRRVLGGLALGALLSAGVVVALPRVAHAASAPGWAPVSNLPTGLGDLFGVACAGDECSAVGQDTTGAPAAIASADGGATWTLASVSGLPGGVLTSVACPTANRCFAVGATDPVPGASGGGGVFLQSEDGGVTWQDDPAGPVVATMSGVPAAAIACPSTSTCVLGGNAPAYSTDAGTSWHIGQLPATLANGSGSSGVEFPDGIDTIACSSSTDCVFDSLPSLYTLDGGATWQVSDTPIGVLAPDGMLTSGILSDAVSCASGGDCVAVGVTGNTFTDLAASVTTDGGNHWSPVTLPTLEDAQGNSLTVAAGPGVVCFGGGHCSAMSSMSAVGHPAIDQVTLESSDGGHTWTVDPLVASPTAGQAIASACSPERCLVAGGDGQAASLESLELDPQNGCTPDAPPSLSIASGDAQTLGPDQAGAPLVVAVACQGPNAAVPIAGAVVHWAAETGPSGAGGDVTAGVSTTDGSGDATVGVSGNGTPGRWYVEASAAPPPPVTDAPPSSTTTTTSTSPPTTGPSTGPVLDEVSECSAADPCTDGSTAAAASVVFDLANTAPAPSGAGPAAPASPPVVTPTAATVPMSDSSLAFTGGPSPLVPLIGASVAVGGLVVVVAFRRRGRRRHRRSDGCRAAARP
jgi:Prealbumin-like fold domain